jgi:hypothetical protein
MKHTLVKCISVQVVLCFVSVTVLLLACPLISAVKKQTSHWKYFQHDYHSLGDAAFILLPQWKEVEIVSVPVSCCVLKYLMDKKQGVAEHPLIPALRRLKQEDCCGLEVCLRYKLRLVSVSVSSVSVSSVSVSVYVSVSVSVSVSICICICLSPLLVGSLRGPQAKDGIGNSVRVLCLHMRSWAGQWMIFPSVSAPFFPHLSFRQEQFCVKNLAGR